MLTQVMSTCCLLGVGGPAPGVVRMDVASGKVADLIRFNVSGGVYALGWRADGAVVAGNRRGDVHFWSNVLTGEALSDQPDRSWHLSAPVLAIAWIDAMHFAVSDQSGRCVIKNCMNDEPDILTEESEGIVSLLSLDKSLYGLSRNGEIRRWDSSTGSLTMNERAMEPADPYALGGLAFWPTVNRLVYGDRTGALVLVNPSDGTFERRAAHPGALHAVMPCQDELLTVGSDGILHVWLADSQEPVRSMEAPTGVIGGIAVGHYRRRLLLITCDGKMSLHIMTTDGLVRAQTLPGGYYRCAAGPSAKEWIDLEKQQANQLVRSYRNQRESGEDGHEDLAALDDLGYRQVSLSLRAEDAGDDGDAAGLWEQFEYLHELFELFEAGRLVVTPDFGSYLDVLCKLWQPQQALNVLEKAQIDRSNAYVESLQQQRRHLASPNCFVETEPRSLCEVLKACEFFGWRPQCKWVVRKYQPRSTDLSHVASQALGPTLSDQKAESLGIQYVSDATWYASGRSERAECLVLPTNGFDGCLSLGVKLVGTLLVPARMIDASAQTLTTCMSALDFSDESKQEDRGHWKDSVELFDRWLSDRLRHLVTQDKRSAALHETIQ